MVAKKKSTTSTKRKPVVKSHAKSKSSSVKGGYRSFKLASDFPPFLQAHLSRQTVYWTILLLFIIIMQLIIIATNINTSLTLDSLHN